MSAPALIARVAAFSMPYLALMAAMPDRSSVKIGPSKGLPPYPVPSRSRDIAGSLMLAGVSGPVRPGTIRCPTITATPGWINVR